MIIKIIKERSSKIKDWKQIIFLGVWRPLRLRIRVFLFGMYHYSYYPIPVLRKYKAIEPRHNIKPKPWRFFNSKLTNKDQIDFKINCAGTIIDISQLPLFWHSESDKNIDQEVINSSHRFHWLLEKLEAGINNSEIYLMLSVVDSWIDEFSDQYIGPAWQPYNVSERLCNWIVFWQASSSQKPQSHNDKFFKSIQAHALLLAGRLEYPASGIINNHILNNARALYISGHFLSNESISNLGYKLFQSHLPEMIGKGGYLLESSSHYQLLLTRSILEVQKIALETNDNDFIEWLGDIPKKMLAASQMLLPINLNSLHDMPRIGDISPDIPFEWFSPLPRLKAGWNNLWNVPIDLHNIEEKDNDGWLNIKSEIWFALVFSHPNNSIYPAGHGHDDFGSFCLYFLGWPIVVDIGQFNYQLSSKKEKKGSEAEMHNTVIIDGKTILPSGGGLSAVISGNAIKNSECCIFDNDMGIRWSTVSQSGSYWSRQLSILSDTEISLKDCFRNAKLAQGYLNFAPNIEITIQTDNRVILAIGEARLIISLDGVNGIWLEESVFYRRYGEQVESKRLHWNIDIDNDLAYTTISFTKE